MEINDILNKLGLDLTNPEIRRGALEAIEAILTSRVPVPDMDLGGSGLGEMETEVELDPDLLQPSVKQSSSGGSNDDIEIEDEENILDQIKHKESEDQIDNTNSDGNDSKSDEQQDSQESDSQDNSNSDQQKSNKPDDDFNTPAEDEGTEQDSENSSDADSSYDSENSTDAEDGEGIDFDGEDDTASDDSNASDDDSNTSVDYDGEDGLEGEDSENEEESESDGEDFDFDENDFIDDELKDSTENEEDKTKHNARRIKRERTLAAAKKALADAQAKRVSPALIRELEKSIEALEALTEAATKSLKDLSDEEFNLLINRTLDAIDACGNSGLTFKSQEEREAQAKEIKADLARAETQNELSAEDVAKIRAETQAIKAREKEIDKYKVKSSSSFKGFKEFLSSLYKAIALQVSTEETRDDSWSAINRRYGGTGILQPGKKVQDLPNKKIPVIDFYFDQSGSWDEDEILVGEKAIQSLADMEANGQIKINVYYFANSVSSDADTVRREGGTYAWNEIVKNVISTQASNVIIMTDSDMQKKWYPNSKPPLKYTVPGYVWYLWKDGSNAPRLPQDLNGRGGVQQFSFNINDI